MGRGSRNEATFATLRHQEQHTVDAGLIVYPSDGRAVRHGESFLLDEEELKLVLALQAAPYRIIGKIRLIEEIWGTDVLEPGYARSHHREAVRALDQLASRVRARFGSEEPLVINRGTGYRLMP